MLNFNTIDNPNSFTNSISLHHFNETPPTSMVTSSTVNQSQSQQQQINLNYPAANANGDQTNWTSSTTIDGNCNRNNNNNNLSNETGRIHQKDYIQQTVINPDESGDRSTMNMGNFLQQKGSENVKRFSVNNLLQLANNCRALADEHRLSSGK